ncbi:unnamed protein product [Parnassius apollo]|uniref:(apollo) hypothetical protein n=1 Tax=Parnassius apollo TaxID=110799 RepID=A0A8S3WMG4_PARAO|nr:unnamed protein product [Parnassius apollo]
MPAAPRKFLRIPNGAVRLREKSREVPTMLEQSRATAGNIPPLTPAPRARLLRASIRIHSLQCNEYRSDGN